VAWTDLFTTPILWFAAMVAIGWLIYLWARRVAPPFHPEGSKTKAFTGGEPIPGKAYQPGYQFFHVALFFTLMHVAAIVVATAPLDVIPWAAILYLLVVTLSLLVLRWK